MCGGKNQKNLNKMQINEYMIYDIDNENFTSLYIATISFSYLDLFSVMVYVSFEICWI